MTKTTWWIVVALIGWSAFFADRALSEDEQPAPKPPTPEQMAKYRAAQQPGPEHAELAKLAGAWRTQTKIWMQPGQPEPMVLEGTATNEMILGGRFLLTRGSTPSMMGNVERLGVMGFDRRKEVYTSTGFDSMGTYGVSAAGTYDAERKAIVMSGRDHDPMLGHTQEYKFVVRVVSEDEYVVEIIFTDAMHTRGQVDEFKMVEVVNTREKE